MNRKKISSIILAFLIISNTIPQSIALGATDNPSAIARILTLNSESKSFTDISKNLVKDTTYTPSIQGSPATDFATDFYIADSSKYIKVTSFNSTAVIPTVNLTSDVLTKDAKYLDCKIITFDNSTGKKVLDSRYENLSAVDYALPSINTNNLNKITIEYNVTDSNGGILKHASQTINADTVAPKLTINSVNFNLNSSTSTKSSLIIQGPKDASENLLTKPVVYLNDKEVTSAITSYDSYSGIYKIAIDMPTTPIWALQVSASDDSLNVGSVSLNNDALINFDNMSGNTIHAGTNNIISGNLPINGNIKNFKINGTDVTSTDNKFTYTNSSKGNINASYTENDVPVSYTTAFSSDIPGPSFKNVTSDSTAIENGGTLNLKTTELNLTGNLSSILGTDLGIDTDGIQYTYDNGNPVTVPFKFDSVSGNFTVTKFIVPNNNESKSGVLTITAHDYLGNKSIFSFNVYAASKNHIDKPTASLNSDDNKPYNVNDVPYFSSGVTPSLDAGSNHLLDLITSNFTLDKYADSSYKQSINSSKIILSDSTQLKNKNNIFSFKTALQDGVYKLTTNLCDIGGNLSNSTSSFVIDTFAPTISITNKSKNINELGYSNSNKVLEDINVSDANLKSAEAVISKNHGVIQTTKDLQNGITSEQTFTDDGFYDIQVSATDNAGNPSNAESKFTIDTTAPVASFDNITPDKYYDKVLDPEINVTEKNIDLASSYFEVKQDDGSSKQYAFEDTNVTSTQNETDPDSSIYKLSNIITGDGKYDVTVHISDLAGNTISKDLATTFYVDRDDITPSISGITSGVAAKVPVTPTITINDEFLDGDDVGAGKSISATLNGENYNLTFVNKIGHKITLTGDTISANSPRGQNYNLVISASNKVTPDVKTTAVNFVIDNEAPVISFSDINNRNIQNGNYYSGTINPVLNISDNHNLASFAITINGTSYSASPDADGNITFIGDAIKSDGIYNISATATDDAGNTTTYDTSFTLDNTAPNIAISGIHNDEYTNDSSVTPTIKISDTNIDPSKTRFNLTRNGQSIPISPLSNDGLYSFNLQEEGSYSLSVTAVDKSGNSSTTAPINFTIDRTSPILNYNFTDGAYINHEFRPSITTADPNDFISTLLINGVSYNPNNIPNFINNMPYQITVQGKDKAGNLSELKTFNFTIDTIAPVLSIQNLIDNSYYNRNVGPNITSTDVNPQTFTMTLNGAPYSNESITKEGNYELVITSVDKAGNISRRVIDFVIDKTAATITIGGLINNSTLTSIITPLIFINDPNADVTILLDGQDYHGGPITTDGKHTLIITTVDRAGNVSTKVITFFLKATKPVIYVKNVENGSSYDHAVTPVISFSKDVVAEDTTMTLDGKSYKQGDSISSTGDHELDITVDDSAGNKVTKKIKFTIVSTSIIATIVPKALHKILPAKITSSKQNLSIVLASVLAILVGIFGIALLKIKSINKKTIKKSDDEK